MHRIFSILVAYLALFSLFQFKIASPAIADTVSAVDTVSSLTSTSASAGDAFYVKGYSAVGDGGGGTFLAVAGTATGDNCVNFPGTGGIHWVRQLNGPSLTVEMCGAKGDGSTDNTAAISAGIAYLGTLSCGGKLVFGPGTYQDAGGHTYTIASNANCVKLVSLQGQGMYSSFINLTGNTKFYTVTRTGSGIYTGPIAQDFTIFNVTASNANAGAFSLSDANGFSLQNMRMDNFNSGVDVTLQNLTSWTEGYTEINVQHTHSCSPIVVTRANASPATASFYGLNIVGGYYGQGNSSSSGKICAFLTMGQDGFAKSVYGSHFQFRENPGPGGNNATFRVDGAGAPNTNNILDGIFDIALDGQGGNANSNNVLFSVVDRTSTNLGKGFAYAHGINFDPYQGNPGYLLDLSTATDPAGQPSWAQISTQSNSLSVDAYNNPQVMLHGIELKIYGSVMANRAPFASGTGFLPQFSTYDLTITGVYNGSPYSVTYLIRTYNTTQTPQVSIIAGAEPAMIHVAPQGSLARLTVTIDNSASSSVGTFSEMLRMH